MIFFPEGVSTDSGWNWTPQWGWVLCLMLITTPSGVEAAIFQIRGKPFYRQRVVSPALQGVLQAPEYAPTIVLYLRGLAVQRPGVSNGSAISQVHGLVAQADAQDRYIWEVQYDLQAAADIPGVGRMSGSRRDHNSERIQFFDLSQPDIVGANTGILIKHGYVIHQVPDEGILVVHKENRPHQATPRARLMAAIFRSVSSYSRSGSESATMPAPA